MACALALGSAGAAAQLPQPIARVMKAHNIPASGVSVIVQSTSETSPRLSLNAEVLRNPASSIKLVTTFVALDLLGPNHTWKTEVYIRGSLKNGTLDGDLVLKGHGDPYLVTEEFWKLVGEIRNQLGIEKITGDLVIDDSIFAPIPGDEDDFDGQSHRLYNVQPSALSVNFKAFDFKLVPNRGAGKVNVIHNPPLPNLNVQSTVKLVNGKCRGNGLKIIMDVRNLPAADEVRFSGSMPASCRKYDLARTALSHPAYVYGMFKFLFRQWGGRIEGTYKNDEVEAQETPRLVWRGRELAEIIRPLNKWSNNLMTRQLLLTLAAVQQTPPVTPLQGAQQAQTHLLDLGLPAGNIIIDNGAGLSRRSRLSAEFMNAMLLTAWRHPYMPEFVSSMAISGKDGTVRKRFRGKREAGKMHLKTGRLDDVVAIAGFVRAQSGETFAVSLFVNHKDVHWGSGTELQNAVLAWTYRQG
ncbi:MAG: D-alanyl-D-alanine carboxypeptidase/D-alanyl-D-alanine-endopeptidase [Pseudomonadota bacterium]